MVGLCLIPERQNPGEFSPQFCKKGRKKSQLWRLLAVIPALGGQGRGLDKSEANLGKTTTTTNPTND